MKVKVTVEILDDINTLPEYEERGQTKEKIEETYKVAFDKFIKLLTGDSGLLMSRMNVEVTDECDW